MTTADSIAWLIVGFALVCAVLVAAIAYALCCAFANESRMAAAVAWGVPGVALTWALLHLFGGVA